MGSQKRRKRYNPSLSIRLPLLFFGIFLTLLCLFVGQYHLAVLAVLIGILSIFWKDINQKLSFLDTLSPSTNLLLAGIILFLGITCICVLPADAIFLDRACGLLQDVFNGAQGTTTQGLGAVQITFNMIRALFLIYLAIALINVFTAFRQQEDWQTAVRAPILAILVVVILDFITGLVVPSQTTTC